MEASNSERVICPKCNKPYRWQEALAGRELPCKECGTKFIIPERPGLGLLVPAEPVTEDEGLYELAADPDDEPLPPPPPRVPMTPAMDESPHESTAAAEPSAGMSATSDDDAEDEPMEPNPHISEAAKATRREEQRLAAAANERPESWRDNKVIWTVAVVVGLFVVIYLAMLSFS